MNRRQLLCAGCLLAAFVGCASSAVADSVTINPVKDNTLIDSAAGPASNALGSIFSGRTGPMLGGERRLRAVLAFDVAGSVPAGSTINSTSLRLRLETTVSADQSHGLHRLTSDWGEGTSSAIGGNGAAATTNDATWTHTFYPDSNWATPGGDFVATASASQTVGADLTNDYIWNSRQMSVDVQAWLDRTACSLGWILIGNETPGSFSAKKFYSREARTVEFRPRLVIDFTPPAFACPADINRSGTVNTDDLIALITTWGTCQPCPAPCAGDIQPSGGNQQVNTDDLIMVITSWGRCD
jgi:hypothetical protein